MKDKCPTCGNRRKLTKHHIIPRRMKDTQITFKLCWSCHEALEKFIPFETELKDKEYFKILLAFHQLKSEYCYADPETPDKIWGLYEKLKHEQVCTADIH